MSRAHSINFYGVDKCFLVAGNHEGVASSRELKKILEAFKGSGVKAFIARYG
jgi:hypothetical protein